MLPTEKCEDDIADPWEGFSPTVAMTAETKALRMERRHRELNVGAFSCCLCPIQGDGVIWHRVQFTSGLKKSN